MSPQTLQFQIWLFIELTKYFQFLEEKNVGPFNFAMYIVHAYIHVGKLYFSKLWYNFKTSVARTLVLNVCLFDAFENEWLVHRPSVYKATCQRDAYKMYMYVWIHIHIWAMRKYAV